MKQPCLYAKCNNTFIDVTRTQNQKYCSYNCRKIDSYHLKTEKESELYMEKKEFQKFLEEEKKYGLAWDSVCVMI